MTVLPESPPTHRKLRQVAVATGIGNFLEWYDFAVYGLLAVLIGQLFFPGGDPVASTLSSLAVFAVGFLFRPLGAIVLGVVGDRFGRRTALVISITAMGAATVLIGLLPTYGSIGVLAPILLIAVRAVQGLSAGGEWTSSSAYLIEGAPPGHRARYGSIISATGALATAFGSFLALGLTAALGQEQMLAFGWRIPFWLAGLLVVVGLVIRLRLDESPVFTRLEDEQRVEQAPLRRGLRANWRPAVLTLAFGTVHGVGYYYLATYAVNYLQVTVHLPATQALLVTGSALLVYAAICGPVGWVVDRVGRRVPNLVAAAGYVLLPVPAFLLMGTGDIALVALALGALVVVQSIASVTCVVLLVELFPASTRASSSAVAFNIAIAFLAGPAPYVGAWLAATFAHPVAPAFYLVGLALVAFVVLLRMLPESRGWDLHTDRRPYDR